MSDLKLMEQTGAGSVGFVDKMITAVQSFEAAKELGQFIISSGYAPKHFDGKPEAVVLAIDAGKKLGLDWFQSLQESFIVNGIPGYKGKILKALVQASSVCEKWETEFFGSLSDGTRGVKITYKRKGQNQQTREYTTEMAKMAGLWGKKKKYDKFKNAWIEYDDAWVKHPEDMLEWKAVSRVLNDFSDITKGFRPVEDLLDYKPENELHTTSDGITVQTAQQTSTNATSMVSAAEEQIAANKETESAPKPTRGRPAAPKKVVEEPKAKEEPSQQIEDAQFEEMPDVKTLEEVRALGNQETFNYVQQSLGFDLQKKLFDTHPEKKTKRILLELYSAHLAGQVETYIKSNFEVEETQAEQPAPEPNKEEPKPKAEAKAEPKQEGLFPELADGQRDFKNLLIVADEFEKAGIAENDVMDFIETNGLTYSGMEDFYRHATVDMLEQLYNA